MKKIVFFLLALIISTTIIAQQVPANSWLNFANANDTSTFKPDSTVIVTGNRLTVEALFTRTNNNNFGLPKT